MFFSLPMSLMPRVLRVSGAVSLQDAFNIAMGNHIIDGGRTKEVIRISSCLALYIILLYSSLIQHMTLLPGFIRQIGVYLIAVFE